MSEKNDEKKLDVTLPVDQIVVVHPEVGDLLAEMGFDEVPAGRTLIELARDAEVSPSVLVFALEASGFEVEGYQAPAEDQFANPMAQVVENMFNDRPYDPSVFERAIAEMESATPSSPMFQRMEDAIRRAEAEGRL